MVQKYTNTDEKIFASLGFNFFSNSAQVCFLNTAARLLKIQWYSLLANTLVHRIFASIFQCRSPRKYYLPINLVNNFQTPYKPLVM